MMFQSITLRSMQIIQISNLKIGIPVSFKKAEMEINMIMGNNHKIDNVSTKRCN